MRRFSIPLLTLSILVIPLLGLLVPAPARAAVYDPLHLVHSEQVSGDFVMAGNGVLVCPTDEGTPRSECLAASRRENTFNNNRFAMTYADVDDDPATYNSSSASVSIPAGSRVTYARLQWGGNRDGQQCGVGASGSYPPGSSATQQVRLRVGGGAPTDVAPAGYTTDTTSIGYYSADAEVTDAFAQVDAGAPVTVTVGNVFAPTGNGCHGGWSLVVVHTDDDAGCAAGRRQVFVYDGHVRQGVNDPPLDVTASGFRVDGGPARVGITAYEGDNGQTGDRLLLNGTPLEDPATGSSSNFFASFADGQVDPAYPNNFSVDAKSLSVPPGVISSGDTSATLRITTTADAFMLQSLVLSVPVPSLCLEKTVDPAVAHPGDLLTWTLRVRNPTTTPVTGVVVEDPAVPDCGRVLGALDAGAETTYTCTSRAPRDDLDNVATATGAGQGGTVLSAAGSASVDVVHPAIEVSKTASVDRAVPGQEVTWEVRVGNSGDTVLDPVRLADPRVPACSRADVGPLAAGATTTVSCSSRAGRDDVSNTVTVTGDDGHGRMVSAQDGSVVAVSVPDVEVQVTAPDAVGRDGSAPVVIEVGDTGETPLLDVTISVPGFASCSEDVGRLEVGEQSTTRCVLDVGADGDAVDTEVRVSGQPVLGPEAAGDRVGDRVALVLRAYDGDPTGTTPSADTPTDTAQADQAEAGPAAYAAGGSLPDTGGPAGLAALLVVGVLALGGGAALMRGRRTPGRRAGATSAGR